MRFFRTHSPIHLAAALIFGASFLSLAVDAQDAPSTEKKPEEVSKVATVEVAPATATTPVGGKLQFKAVAKDAAGQPLPDAVKYWFAAPFDAATADEHGEISFVQPGEITIGAVV